MHSVKRWCLNCNKCEARLCTSSPLSLHASGWKGGAFQSRSLKMRMRIDGAVCLTGTLSPPVGGGWRVQQQSGCGGPGACRFSWQTNSTAVEIINYRPARRKQLGLLRRLAGIHAVAANDANTGFWVQEQAGFVWLTFCEETVNRLICGFV